MSFPTSSFVFYWSLTMFHFLTNYFVTNLELPASFKKCNIFWYSTLYIILLCFIFLRFSARKTFVALSSSSNFPVKLICWGMFVFVCLDKSMSISLKQLWWYEKSNQFPVPWIHYFSKFFVRFLFVFYGLIKKWFIVS